MNSTRCVCSIAEIPESSVSLDAIGVTKHTAAGAITTLRSVGLITAVRVQASDGQSRSGHQLNLSEGISIRGCPQDQDTAPRHKGTYPDEEYTRCLYPKYAACPNGTSDARLGNADSDGDCSATHVNPVDDDPLLRCRPSSNLRVPSSVKAPRKPAVAPLVRRSFGDSR
jgi:hypothetical protein